MKRDRHSRRHNNSGWKGNGRGFDYRDEPKLQKKRVFRPTIQSVSQEQIREDAEAIKKFKAENQPVCPKCGNPVLDMSTAIFDTATGQPIHFDCMLSQISHSEKLEQGDKVTYIGQGRFGIVNFPDPRDQKKFTIKKIIDIESKETKAEWRGEMADLYSRVK